jgi:hypothetical protein
MRKALRAQADAERTTRLEDRVNIVLFCDTDVVFRDPSTLHSLGHAFAHSDVAFAGEMRRHLFPYPEAQASFLAVRRDWLEDPRTAPWVNHGSPAYWMQRSIWRGGGLGLDFPSNKGGFVLHRGRSGVAAAARFHPGHSYSRGVDARPHFMGVDEGARIWQETESNHHDLLSPGQEEALAKMIGRSLGYGGS